MTAPVTLAECLIQPHRSGMTALEKKFTDVIVNGQNTDFKNIDQQIAMRAVDLRASYNIALLDALQIGIALNAGCDAFLTNDIVLRRVNRIKVIVVDDLEL